MKHLWSVICSKYIISEVSKNLSLIEIADVLTFKTDLPNERPLELPLPCPLYLVSSWTRESDAEAQVIGALVRVRSPDGSIMQELPFHVDFRHTLGCRTYGTVSSIPYTNNGTYEFEVCIEDGDDWIAVGSIPVQIFHLPPDDKSEVNSPKLDAPAD